ncbi:receptor activity-modifying protein 2 [Gambusia affinis]|uniref:receptor activity-modifying protein 2 n=1 Tax=Gambusia affinis TaxID=33528 RepID=UPI000F39FC34|nr:receptor activity-modifying protein 2 [Gambusia affinis]
MNRALFSKMTVTRFSLVFSGCLVTLLIWGCTNVICLDNDKATVQLVTTTVKTTRYNETQTMDNEIPGHQLQYPCVNGLHCQSICDICEHRYGQPSVECLSFLFDEYLHLFSEQMRSLNSTDWCVWDKVSSFYSDFSTCTEHLSDCLGIPWPNSLVEKLFVNIHSEYFKTCPTEEFSDPPPGIVFALVITPICLIPVMVSLVVIKTKNGDGTS